MAKKSYDLAIAAMVQAVIDDIAHNKIILKPASKLLPVSLEAGYYLTIGQRGTSIGAFIMEVDTEVQIASLVYKNGNTTGPRREILYNAAKRLADDRKYIANEIKQIQANIGNLRLGAEYQRKLPRRSIIVDQGNAMGVYEVTFRDLGSTMAMVKLESNGGRLKSEITYIR